MRECLRQIVDNLVEYADLKDDGRIVRMLDGQGILEN